MEIPKNSTKVGFRNFAFSDILSTGAYTAGFGCTSLTSSLLRALVAITCLELSPNLKSLPLNFILGLKTKKNQRTKFLLTLLSTVDLNTTPPPFSVTMVNNCSAIVVTATVAKLKKSDGVSESMIGNRGRCS